jgi:hypothetical protein
VDILIAKIAEYGVLYISNITAESLHWVALNMRKRANACIAECSGHFQHLT